MQAIFEEAVKFAFKDKSWILKILIGGVISLIPVVNLIFIIGYTLSVLRDSVDNKPASLPDWTNWANYGKDGLNGLLILIVYGIPMILLGALATVPAVGKLFYVLFFLVYLVTVPLYTLGLIGWYKDSALKGAFDFKGVWKTFSGDMQNYVIATLVLAIVPFIVSLILQYSGHAGFRSPILFFPGAFLQLLVGCLWFWLSIVGARVFGQLYGAGATSSTPEE